jgi:hypothetical protein
MNPIPASPKWGKVSDYDANNFHDKKFRFLLRRHTPNPTLKFADNQTGVSFPLTYSLLLYDTIFCQEKKEQRVIRYIPGELSIYMDEQSPDDKNPKKLFRAEFIKGEFTVDGTDTQLLKFMMLCNYNGSNQARNKTKSEIFILLDASIGMKHAMARDKKVDECKKWCYDGDWDEVLAYARALNIDTSSGDVEQIRYQMRMLVDRDIDRFIAGMNNPGVKRKHYIMEAIDRGYLTVNNANGTVGWTSGGIITTAPHGKNPIDHFVESTFSKEGEEVYSNVMSWVRPKKREATSITAPTIDPPAHRDPSKDLLKPASTISDSEIKDVVAKAVSFDIMTQNGTWYSWEGQKFKGAGEVYSWMRENPDMFGLMKLEVEKRIS